MKRLALFLLCILPCAVVSQTRWARHAFHPPVAVFTGVEATFVSFKNVQYSEMSGFAANAFARIPVPGLTIVLEVPYARTKTKFMMFPPFSFELSKSAIGNPYVGLAFGSDLPIEVGVRLPVVDDESSIAGIAPTTFDFLTVERYLPKALSLQASLEGGPHLGDLVRVHLKGGPIAWIPVPAEGREVEMLLEYEAGLGAGFGPVVAAVGVTGRVIVTESRLIGNKSTAHAFQGEVGASFGPVHPSLYYRALLGQEQFSDAVRSIIGAVVIVSL